MIITAIDSYHIESERESGYGRVDIIMTPKDKNRPGIIIEMKKTASAKLQRLLLKSPSNKSKTANTKPPSAGRAAPTL